jgi:iron uptake system EfeUOB component EfeO/EfeM
LTTLAATPISTWFHVNKADVANWILRSHEIIEDAIRDSLSGDDDYGSGTEVASIVTDSTAAHLIVKLLRPDLDQYAPGLYQRSSRALRHVRTFARSTKEAGTWVALHSLSRQEREQLNAAASHAAQVLAPIPDVLHLSNT